MGQDRRSFLKTGAVTAAAAVAGCAPEMEQTSEATAVPLDTDALVAVGKIVLPGELDAEQQAAVVRGFRDWADGYDPVAEMNHGYGTAEIRYGPPDPKPAWAAQLQALELEAQKRHATSFEELAPEQAETLVRRHIGNEGPRMPSPLAARHVGVALLAHWLTTADATDRCYKSQIGILTCRGIESSPREPEPLA